MGTCGSFPNYDAWLQTAWGAGSEFWAAPWWPVAGFVNFGTSPPYTLNNFLAFHPKFFNAPTTCTGVTTTIGSNAVTLDQATSLTVGQFVVGTSFPDSTVVTAITGASTITVNNNAIVAVTDGVLQAYQTPLIPIPVLQAYINLARKTLPINFWADDWWQGVGLFVAHYATLWLRTDALSFITAMQTVLHGEVPQGTLPGTAFTLSMTPPNSQLQSLTKNGLFQTPGIDYTLLGASITMLYTVESTDALYATWPTQVSTTTFAYPTAAQAVAQGLAAGILTSKSVGDVSAGYTTLESLASWGAWNYTLYGQQLATMGKIIGIGPTLVW